MFLQGPFPYKISISRTTMGNTEPGFEKECWKTHEQFASKNAETQNADFATEVENAGDRDEELPFLHTVLVVIFARAASLTPS